MKTFAKIAVAGLAAALVTTTAIAQSSNASATGQANANENAAGANYGMLISGLNNGSLTSVDPAVKLAEIDDTATVDIALLSEVKGAAAENAAALDKVLAEQDAWVSGVQSAVEANETLKTALDAEGYAASDVVAFDTTGSGMVTLIVDDSAM